MPLRHDEASRPSRELIGRSARTRVVGEVRGFEEAHTGRANTAVAIYTDTRCHIIVGFEMDILGFTERQHESSRLNEISAARLAVSHIFKARRYFRVSSLLLLR